MSEPKSDALPAWLQGINGRIQVCQPTSVNYSEVTFLATLRKPRTVTVVLYPRLYTEQVFVLHIVLSSVPGLLLAPET